MSEKMIHELEGKGISHAFYDIDHTGTPFVRIHLQDGSIFDIYGKQDKLEYEFISPPL